MAFPSVVSVTGYTGPTTTSTSWTPFSGKSVGVGNLLILIVNADGNPALSSSSSGWIELEQRNSNATSTSSLFYKIATSSSETFTLTTNASELYSAHLYEISGATSLSATSLATLNGTTAPPSHDAGSVRDHLWITVVAHTNGSAVSTAAPSGYGNLLHTPGSNTTTSSGSTSSSYRTATNQVETPGAYTFTGSTFPIEWTIATWGTGGEEPPPSVDRIPPRFTYWL